LSDKEHSTPGSKEFWQAQIRRKKFDIYRINIKTNFKRKAKDYKENQIWGKYLKAPFNIIVEDFDDIIETDNIFNFDSDDDSTIDFEIEELDKKTISELESEFGIGKGYKKLNMEDIRLIAQKYVTKQHLLKSGGPVVL
jgi:hypothetical protein